MKPPRPEVRPQLPRLDPFGQPGRTATAQLGSRATCRQLPVEEHGQPELLAQPVGENERLGAGGSSVGRFEVDDRRHVDRADTRVDPDMPVEVDPADRLGSALQHRAGQAPGLPSQREHAAVVVGVGVDPEQARVERSADRLDGDRVPALRDVRDRQQRRGHYRT